MSESTATRSVHYLKLRYVLVAIVALLIIGSLLWPTFNNLAQTREFHAQERRIEAIVETWRTTPPEADPDYWEAGWGTVYNALGNVCFTKDHVSQEEMEKLYQDVKAKDAEPNSWDRLEWLWYRLAKTGPHGRKYIDQMQPLWDEVSSGAEEGEKKPEELPM